MGFCSNHSNNFDFEFKNCCSIELIKDAFQNGVIHLSNDALFFAISKIGLRDTLPRPIIILPLCSHDINSKEKQIILEIISEFESMNPNGVINSEGTDGDGVRRKVLNDLREPVKDDWFADFKNFDRTALLGRIGINFDPKHLLKRIRGTLIGDKRSITLLK
jgi:hypothetical protein